MEIYAGHNKVTNLKEIQHLKNLPKLIILDLSGNAMTNDSRYRLYSIYHLRKLKVLDGVGINTNELSLARDQFSGRLTLDFMVEKLGHENFGRISELDLSSCRIRHIEEATLSGQHFQNLLELNLDNNFLTSLHGLQNLNKLVVLRINHNRLSVLECGFSAMVRVVFSFRIFHHPSTLTKKFTGTEKSRDSSLGVQHVVRHKRTRSSRFMLFESAVLGRK